MQNQTHLENLKYPIGKYVKPKSILQNDIQLWISEIESFPTRIKQLTHNLSVEQLNWIYRPDGWTIKQVVHHCADSHMNSFIRFKLALTEENPIIKPYEEQLWAVLADSLDNTITGGSIAIIDGLHYRWVLLLKSLNQEQLKKRFMHPASKIEYSLDEVIGLYAWHCNHHLAHIEQALACEGKF